MKKLTDEDVHELRESAAEGVPDDVLADRYRIALVTARDLRLGKFRANAGGPITRRSQTTSAGELAELRARVADLEHAVSVLLGRALEKVRT